MRFMIRMLVLHGLLALPACSPSSAAVIGGTYYAVQYDFAEFFAATDHRNFQVILVGNPFPSMDANTVARDLLPVMHAAKPPPALTFTYEAPVESPRPRHRLVVVVGSPPGLGSCPVCKGGSRTGRPPPRPILI